jgi:biotin carboxyl carrier protein
MPIRLVLEGEEHFLDIVARSPQLVVELDGRRYCVSDEPGPNGARSIFIDDKTIGFAAAVDHNSVLLHFEGRTLRVDIPDPRDALSDLDGGADDIVAPMPGTVVRVARQPGEAVSAGDTVVVIESMKLQMSLAAQRDGTIMTVDAQPNETFEKGAVLARLEPNPKS